MTKNEAQNQDLNLNLRNYDRKYEAIQRENEGLLVLIKNSSILNLLNSLITFFDISKIIFLMLKEARSSNTINFLEKS